MKYLQLFLAVGVLNIALATSALAGEIPLPGVTAASSNNVRDAPIVTVASIDPVTEIALNIAQSVLSLF